MHRRRICLGLSVAFLVLVFDQVSKASLLHAHELYRGGVITIFPGLLNLVVTRNVGIIFGPFGFKSAYIVLIPIALGVLAALIVWLFRAGHVTVSLAIGAILGGALGNVIDRMCYGQAVDFLHLHWRARDLFPYVFNVADAAIVIGVAMMTFDHLSVAPTPTEADAKSGI